MKELLIQQPIETSVHQTLHKLKNNPTLDRSLVLDERFSTLRKEEQRLNGQPCLSPQHLFIQLSFILKHRQDFNLSFDMLSTIVEEAHSKTNYFHEYQETNLFDMVKNGFRGVRNFRVPVKWNEEKKMKSNIAGFYNSRDGIINIRSPIDGTFRTLDWLAWDGTLPHATETLLHEIVHTYQFPTDRIQRRLYFSRLIQLFTGNSHLREIHAQRVSGGVINRFSKNKIIHELVGHGAQLNLSSDIIPQENMDEVKNYIDEIDGFNVFASFLEGIGQHLTSNPFDYNQDFRTYPNYNKRQLRYAFDAIDQLNALGYTVPEIGEIVMWCGRWDSERYNFPRIQSIIDARCKELNLTNEELEKLVEVDCLEREVARLKTRDIARKHIRKVYEELGGTQLS